MRSHRWEFVLKPKICRHRARSQCDGTCRFDARLRVVHKAEAAIRCHHTQLGALLKRAAGAIYFKKTVNVCDVRSAS